MNLHDKVEGMLLGTGVGCLSAQMASLTRDVYITYERPSPVHLQEILVNKGFDFLPANLTISVDAKNLPLPMSYQAPLAAKHVSQEGVMMDTRTVNEKILQLGSLGKPNPAQEYLTLVHHYLLMTLLCSENRDLSVAFRYHAETCWNMYRAIRGAEEAEKVAGVRDAISSTFCYRHRKEGHVKLDLYNEELDNELVLEMLNIYWAFHNSQDNPNKCLLMIRSNWCSEDAIAVICSMFGARWGKTAFCDNVICSVPDTWEYKRDTERILGKEDQAPVRDDGFLQFAMRSGN